MFDPRPLNFILNPENGYPIVPYQAEYKHPISGQKDEYLLGMIEDIENLKKMDDVRPYLSEQFKVRQTLKSAKLI